MQKTKNMYQIQWCKKNILSTCETVKGQVVNVINVMHHSGQQSPSQPQHCCRLLCVCVWKRERERDRERFMKTFKAFMNMCKMRTLVSGVDLH